MNRRTSLGLVAIALLQLGCNRGVNATVAGGVWLEKPLPGVTVYFCDPSESGAFHGTVLPAEQYEYYSMFGRVNWDSLLKAISRYDSRATDLQLCPLATQTRIDAQFEVKLKPGEYWVYASFQGDRQIAYWSQAVTVKPGENQLDLSPQNVWEKMKR